MDTAPHTRACFCLEGIISLHRLGHAIIGLSKRQVTLRFHGVWTENVGERAYTGACYLLIVVYIGVYMKRWKLCSSHSVHAPDR